METKKRLTTSMSSGLTTPAQMKSRTTPAVTRATAKGTKPLPEPTTVSEILTKVVVYGCKKVLFLSPKIRLTGYAVLLFLASLIADYMPFPKTYFAYSDNIPNQYFVKFSWAWTLVLVAIFMFLTASVYCGGDVKRILRHFSRLLVGTFVWFFWTNVFRYIEETTGQCLTQEGPLYSIRGKRACSSKQGRWASFDISGHAFLLMWCVFLITEETKAIAGWDSIKDFIRNEEHNRSRRSGTSVSSDLFPDTPLRNLSPEEFDIVKKKYSQYATIANIQLVFLTLLVLLWDLMLAMTAIYFHSMIEKVIGGLIAAFMWFAVYECFYHWNIFINPGLPGTGLFEYSTIASSISKANPTTSSSNSVLFSSSRSHNKQQRLRLDTDLPTFLGMPLNPLGKKTNDLSPQSSE